MATATKRFIVKYTDATDVGCPVFEWRCYAFDDAHALLKFEESNAGDGWRALSVDRPRTPHGYVDTQYDRVAA